MEARKKPSGMTRDLTCGKHSWSYAKMPTSTSTSLAAGILVLVCILACSTLGESRYEAVDVMLDEVDFYNTYSYQPLYSAFFTVLNNTVPRFAYDGHVYLGIKDCVPFGSPPARWIKLPIRGETDEDRATLAFSDNDLYLRAFQNNQGIWHVFLGFEHMFPAPVVVINSADVDETYVTLVKGYQNLVRIPLGRDVAVGVARTLGRYRHGMTPESELKMALVQCMIMIPEGMRIRPIRELFSNKWDREMYLTRDMAKYVVQWTDVSKLLYIFEKTNVWDISQGTGLQVYRAIQVAGANRAKEIYDFLRRPKPLRVPDF